MTRRAPPPKKQPRRTKQPPLTKHAAQNAVAQVQERLKKSHATRGLGFRVESVEVGVVVFRMRVRQRHRQMHGVVHGGILATLADTVAAVAAFSTLAPGSAIATIEMKINFLEAVSEGNLRAEGRVLRTGRNFVVVDCEIRNDDGTLAAKALLTFGAVSDRVSAQLKERE
ncbi:MAG: PaaI family thioesterase [Candidatus Acidiferrum sp.]